MLELLKQLKDLKSLLGPAYYADLTAIVYSALAGDWREVYRKLCAVLVKAGETYLFGDPVAVMYQADAEATLDKAFDELEGTTVEVKVAGAGEDAVQFDPTPYVELALMLANLIKKWRERRGK